MTPQEFIQKIAPLHVYYAKLYGFKVASAGIAQACLESAYGTSKKAQYHNYHGLKYKKNRVNCNNGYFNDGGSEQNKDGSYTQLASDTSWYAFAGMPQGVEGYYQFINTTNYAKVKEAGDALTYLQEIKKAGYATSLDYVKNVYMVVQKWDLTKYDDVLNGKIDTPTNIINSIDNTTNSNSINIIKRTSTHNTTTKPNRQIDWIVLHYTAGVNSKQGSAQGTANYFAKTTNQASADFIVDDVEIVQYNPDPKNYYCWAVGGNAYSSKVNSLSAKYYGICKNNNSVSIEMCSRKTNTATLNATDNDWYLTDATVNNAVKLTKYLMNLYNIKADHVIMHNMVTGKWCPQPWVKNEAALSGWYNFLAKIGAAAQVNVTPVLEPAPAIPYTVRITANLLNIRSGPDSKKYSIIGSVRKGEVYTIVDQQNNFGKLKSGAGWICLDYTEKTK